MLITLSCNLDVLKCICLLYRFEAEGKTASSHQIIEALSLQLYQERTCKFAEVRAWIRMRIFLTDSHPKGTHMRQGSLHDIFGFRGVLSRYSPISEVYAPRYLAGLVLTEGQSRSQHLCQTPLSMGEAYPVPLWLSSCNCAIHTYIHPCAGGAQQMLLNPASHGR